MGHLPRRWRLGPSRPAWLVRDDGPLEGEVRQYIASHPIRSVILMGYRKPSDAIALLKDSIFLVVPSECYEVFPNVIVEALVIKNTVPRYIYAFTHGRSTFRAAMP